MLGHRRRQVPDKRFMIIQHRQAQNNRMEGIMPVVIMVVIMPVVIMPVIIIMIVIMMMMVMVEMLTAGEGFIFKPEAENRLEGGSITSCDHHRRGAIGEGVQSARHALTRRAVNQVAFGDDEDIGGGNLIAEQLIHRGFVIEFRVSLTLGLQCIEISGHHAIGKRGTIHPVSYTHLTLPTILLV